MHDFAVVGAGPAGTRFARSAAERGRSVAVFERGTVGTPLACSGHVSTDIWDYLPADARDALLQNEIRGARFHTGGPTSRAHRFYKDRPVSNVIDRVELDRMLAEVAREAGARVYENHGVVDVALGADDVTLQVRTPDGTRTETAGMVVGCDGPTSRVRAALDLPDPDRVFHGILGFDTTPDHGDFVDVHLTAPGFFAWRIPRGEAGIEYGVACRPDADPQSRFERLVDGYEASITTRCSGAIPIGPPDRVTAGRGLLIGDAAAQTKPFTGGGILYGMTAADHAATTVDPSVPESLRSYERAWRADLARDIRLGEVLRRCYRLPTPIQRLGLWLFSGPIGVHMDRPTSFFSRSHLRALLRRG